jgi:glycosyltransferase involved in cell wall biosynthesis
MDDRPLVSIVVPSFNVEPYIKKCLDSIKAQTYDNWECIIVDRPSTKDDTTAIIKEYIKDDSRFRFIAQINKGVSDGRNVGFNAAKGKYVQFTDPDDWLSPELLKLAVKRAEDTNAEIVQFAWSNYYVRTDQYVDTGFMPFARKFPRVFSVQGLGEEIFKYGEICINSMSKLWQREFLRRAHLHYPTELKRAEDLAEVSRLVMNASRITYLDKVLYFYKVDEYLGDSLSNFVSDDGHNLDFYKAITVVRSNMKKMKLLPRLVDSFCLIAINNSMHALHMSRLNLAANREVYECVRSQIFPMIADELKILRPELHELFTNCDYDKYLERQMKDLYFDNQTKQERIQDLESENTRIKNKLVTTKTELDSYFSIKRSAKLTLGNIKRRAGRK